MNHRRVVQEKSKLVNDLRRLRGHLDTYEPTLQGLEEKYQVIEPDTLYFLSDSPSRRRNACVDI